MIKKDVNFLFLTNVATTTKILFAFTDNIFIDCTSVQKRLARQCLSINIPF